jgi:TolB-like protein
VRTEARRLRALLNEYYLGDGKGDALVIELPKGGYVPEFRKLEGTSPSRSSDKSRLRKALVLASLALAVAGATWWRFHSQTAPIPIAVLPLVNLSQDPANDYFADGLTSEIIRNLSIIEGLAVRSQTSSFVFKGRSRNVREAGKQLTADYILEGSVLRSGQQLRINAQLVRVRDDFPVWSGRYDRELTDIFAIQDEISRGIVNSLRLKLGVGGGGMRPALRPMISTFAHAPLKYCRH